VSKVAPGEPEVSTGAGDIGAQLFTSPQVNNTAQADRTEPRLDARNGLRLEVVGPGLDARNGLRLDARNGLRLNAWNGLGRNASNGLGLDTRNGLGLEAVGLGLDARNGLGLDASNRLGLDARNGLGLKAPGPGPGVTLECLVNVGVTVQLNWSGFSIVTKEMGRARSSLAFSYYTGITPPMTILPSSPTVKGFTVNNLSGSVRYRWRPLAAA